ncbi:CAZyme family GT22 [Penicillium verhagenii]|uniref:CAZyme family GT22 n=1 Tax=Penicillium verhagenii TaxID=1562060 RepID=UPI002545A9A5|nr:CAZyme family GT22 [Penicillium verhagenii]KAJ5927734.1 CAZyme family GT22 [Penicillium verhagenii]
MLLSSYGGLLLAAVACILHPTNIIIWTASAAITLIRGTWNQRKRFVREVLLCGSTILMVSGVADRLFYGVWTFPPLRFLYFNIAQSLAVFYGRNNWHYYATEGYPLLLTTLIPFAIPALYFALITRDFSASHRVQNTARVQLALICILMPFFLSLISHKEVRFIYPLLPCLHILAAPRLVHFFWSDVTSSSHAYPSGWLMLLFLIFVNGTMALYTSVYHASGPLNVLEYFRHQHEIHSASHNGPAASFHSPESRIAVGFLMPCHSTSWRSHMVYPSIHTWALSCEPPIDLDETQKVAYRDEADRFYDDPDQFLRQNMAGGLRHLPRRASYLTEPRATTPLPGSSMLYEWPDYLQVVFFAQLEPTMRECLRTWNDPWNTAWHDHWRRHGHIVVWCLDSAEQDAWRSQKHRRAQENRDHQFERILTAIKQNARPQQKRGLASLMSGSPSNSQFSFASLQRTAQSIFILRSSSPWPWGKRSRVDAFLANFRRENTNFQGLT